MSEWIPVVEKLIDLGHYWVTTQLIEAIVRHFLFAIFLLVVGFLGLKIVRDVAK